MYTLLYLNDISNPNVCCLLLQSSPAQLPWGQLIRQVEFPTRKFIFWEDLWFMTLPFVSIYAQINIITNTHCILWEGDVH